MAGDVVTFGKAMNNPGTKPKVKCVQPILNLHINDYNSLHI